VVQVTQLARATGDGDPRAALSAAVELRRAAGRLEAEVVRRARGDGLVLGRYCRRTRRFQTGSA
jgi:hypothetical protein